MAIVCGWCGDGLCDPPKSNCSMPGICSCECQADAERVDSFFDPTGQKVATLANLCQMLDEIAALRETP